MTDAGILAEDEPVELVEGALIVVSPQGPLQSTAIQLLAAKLRDAYAAAGHLRIQMPIEANASSLPEPDVAVVRGDILDYATRHPRGTDCLLVVEIAVSSQLVDRAKASTYASAGVESYWLLDVSSRRLEVRTHPSVSRAAYGVTTLLDQAEEVQAPGLEQRWLVADLFPR